MNLPKISMSWRPEKEQKGKFKIIEASRRRVKSETDDLVKAVEMAQSKVMQNRIPLYDHYLQTLQFDTVVTSLIEKRLDNLDNKELVLFKGEEPFEDFNYFIKAPRFQAFIKDLIFYQKFWGMGFFEFYREIWNDKPWFDYAPIPIKHINPYAKEVLVNQWDAAGVNWEDRGNVLFVGDPDNLGLLQQITLLSIYNRFGMFSYSEYLELASQNFAQLKVREYGDEGSVQEMQRMIENRGRGGVAKVPDGMDIEMMNQSSTQQNQLFEAYMERVEKRMSKLILGQSMTTDDGSSRSQAEVHQSEQDQKYSADEKQVLDILNYEFIELLPIWDFVRTPDMEFKFVPTNQDDIKQKLNNYTALKNLGMEFTTEELKAAFENIL